MAYGAKIYRMMALRATTRRGQFRGDPGLFGSIGKFIGKIAKPALSIASVIPGLGTVLKVGSLAGKVAGLAAGAKLVGGIIRPPNALGMSMGGRSMLSAAPEMAGVRSGSSTVDQYGRQVGRAGGLTRKYRRMNATNMRALTRAIRRVKRFEKLARQSITISSHVRVRKGARGRKG